MKRAKSPTSTTPLASPRTCPNHEGMRVEVTVPKEFMIQRRGGAPGAANHEDLARTIVYKSLLAPKT